MVSNHPKDAREIMRRVSNGDGLLARAAGDTLLRSDEIRQERTFIGNRLASEVELTAFADAWPRYEAAAEALHAKEGVAHTSV